MNSYCTSYPCITVNSPFKTECACITVYSTDYESKHVTMPLIQNHAEVNSPSLSCIYSSFYSSNCYGNPPQMVPCLHSSYASFNTLLSVNNPLPLSTSLTFNSNFLITVNSPNSVNTIMSDKGPINTI